MVASSALLIFVKKMRVAKKLILDKLSPIYRKEEIDSISRLIFEKVTGLSALQVHLNQHQTISAANLAQITQIINRLIQFEPIQYILGESDFYGLKLKVNSDVLIPRQETEELVDWIINEYKGLTPSILDIGTGSGCIPIALVKNITGASAVGWDISAKALRIAKENAFANNVNVNFLQVDILKPNYPPINIKYDIIVSNPPYVTISDQLSMKKNVIDYEPHVALFVSDNDPLVFYRAIADLAPAILKAGGKLYLETNERFGNDTVELLSSKGFINIILQNDINGKERMIKAENCQ
jgi:release factor glutamine methyltransferase